MKITALAPWYGSNRMLAEKVGGLLRGCPWVGVPFAGGMSEVARIDARTVLVSDLHRHVVNLARVVADPELNPLLRERLDALAFHPDELSAAQEACRRREAGTYTGTDCPLWWAADYFVCSWMARSAIAGTAAEFDAPLATRWTAGGGDSAVRFRNAAAGLAEWQRVMRRCTFVCLDVFDLLAKVKDEPGHGLYLDPPFPSVGDKYRHNCGDTPAEQRDWHTRLRDALGRFAQCRTVCRFYRHPLVEELYPADRWRWVELDGGRTQANAAAPEVLLVREGRP